MHHFILTKSIDFTQGSVVREVVLFSLPIVFGELLQNLYNSVDAIIVGNLVGDNALAAVTVCGTIANLIVNFFNGMSVGTSVVVSQAFGAKRENVLNSTVCITFTFSALLGAALSILGIIFAAPLLHLAGTRPDYYVEALSYLRIYLAGLMFTVIYNCGAGILRAIGDSQTPFYILSLACIMNIILDYIFVAVFYLGIIGVAIATILSQGLSMILVYKCINRKRSIRCFSLNVMLNNGKSIITSVLSIGTASGLQSALIGLSNLFVVRYMNLFDTAAVAGIGITQRLDKFIILPAKSFGLTMTTYVSQNIGAEKYERIRLGKQRCLILGTIVTVTMSLLVLSFSRQVVSLFNPNADVIMVGTSMLKIICPLFFLMAIRECYAGVLRGYKKTIVPMLLSLIGMVGVRQLFLFFAFKSEFKIQYIYWCYPIAWFASTVLILIYYAVIRRSLPGLYIKDRVGLQNHINML